MRSTDSLWKAVESRDASVDGRFFYGVTTTGVYCRPACPSRLPLRENVRFFDNSQDAVRAGFRACKRCCPEDGTQSALRRESLERARLHIEQSLEPVRLDELASLTGFSKFHLQRLFRESFGLTPAQYANQVRVQRARTELRSSDSV